MHDGTLYTSAGVAAGIDLALALVEEDHGPDVSREVARSLVVHLQRAGGQPQVSASLRGSPPRSPALRRVVDLVTADPAGGSSLAVLAGRLNVSTRHLTRLFREELGTTPARYVESIRFDIAKSFLDQGHTATRAAALAGFPSYESLRRVFARKLSRHPRRAPAPDGAPAPAPSSPGASGRPVTRRTGGLRRRRSRGGPGSSSRMVTWLPRPQSRKRHRDT
ncbi:transcriptional regulator GlxA family with amidase domain [Streptomyces canus]